MFLAVLGLLSGCGGENNGSTQKDNSVQKANADKSSTNYQIKVATTGVQPPFSYLDEKGNLIGMDIEIIKAIGEVQGFDIKFETMSWADMLPSVGAGKNDLAISGVSYNDERNEAYTLSKKYLHVPSAIMVVDPSIQSLSDLGGKRFDCMTGAKQCQDISTAVPTATIHDINSSKGLMGDGNMPISPMIDAICPVSDGRLLFTKHFFPVTLIKANQRHAITHHNRAF